MGYHDFDVKFGDIFRKRRSVRKYEAREVPHDVIFKLIEAARWAPSAHNSQPWRFVILEKGKVKFRLAEAMASAWMRDLIRSGMDEEKAAELVRRKSIERYVESPVVILACLDRSALKDDSKEEYLMGVQGLAAALENLLLAASMEGLGACWTCGPLYCQDDVRKALNLPEEWEPQAAITLGYPKELPKTKERKSIGEIAFEHDGRLKPWEGSAF